MEEHNSSDVCVSLTACANRIERSAARIGRRCGWRCGHNDTGPSLARRGVRRVGGPGGSGRPPLEPATTESDSDNAALGIARSAARWQHFAGACGLSRPITAHVVEGCSAATTYVRLLREAVERQITASTWQPKVQARRGDALSRSQGLITALGTGRYPIVGQLPDLEADMPGWEAAQRQLDSVAADTTGFETLTASAAGQATIPAPMTEPLSQRRGRPAIAGIDGVTFPPLNQRSRRISGR